MGNIALRYPVDYVTITRPYNSANHWGMDLGYGAATGPDLPIYAAAAGIVVAAVDGRSRDPNGGWGNRVQIDHGDGSFTLYAHLKAGSLLVGIGDFVARGQQIATMGDTGNTRGTHLHFELYEGGTSYTDPNLRIDPAPSLYVFPGQTVSELNDYPELIQYYEEDTDQAVVQFSRLYQDMLQADKGKPQSSWSAAEGWWDIATQQGLVDGTGPQNPLTRQEFIAVLGRLGLIKKG